MALRSVCACNCVVCCCYFWRNAIVAQNTKSSNNKKNNNTENTRNKFCCCCCSHKSLSHHSLSPVLLLSGRTVASQRRAHTHTHTCAPTHIRNKSTCWLWFRRCCCYCCFPFALHFVFMTWFALCLCACVWVCLITTVAVLVCVCPCSLAWFCCYYLICFADFVLLLSTLLNYWNDFSLCAWAARNIEAAAASASASERGFFFSAWLRKCYSRWSRHTHIYREGEGERELGNAFGMFTLLMIHTTTQLRLHFV